MKPLSYFVACSLGLFCSLRPVSAQKDDKDDKTKREEHVFSGPQKGEKLLPFKVTGLHGDDEGKEIDFVRRAAGKPVFLVFVHQRTRPSIGLTRMLTRYTLERRKDGLHSGIVWLQDDRSAAEEYLRRARRSLNLEVPIGISVDGAEGPGAYGLNRKVTLTILVGVDDRVTANFALVRPSDRDAKKILEAVVELIGGEVPSLDKLRPQRRMAPMDRRLRGLLRRLANKDADPAAVKKIAAEVDAYVGDDRARQRSLGVITKRWSDRPDFNERGTPAAREQVEAWAKKYSHLAAESKREQDPRFRELLRPVIQKDAAPEEVDRAAAAVEKYVSGHPERERQLGEISRRVVGSKIFAEGSYGIPRAHEHLRAWATKYVKKTRL